MPTKTRAKTIKRATKAPARKKTATPRASAKTLPKTTPPKTTPKAKAKPPAKVVGTNDVMVGARRAVFIDVENTSSESELVRVLEELDIDLTSGTTEVSAIGNWRVVGQQLGRSLAQRGANLVHSAPATRVSDWSDLWIAVHAGIWLGRSRPGDVIDIVSHDRAFDAVGDAAARLGVTFRRITYRSASASAATTERASEPAGERRPRRRRRRGGSGRTTAGHTTASTSHARPTTTSHAPARVAQHEDEPQAASQIQLQQVIARLAAADPAHTVTLDALTVALKAAGFQRPAGSPRLVTRLRRMKDIEVLPNGRVRLNAAGEASVSHALAEPLAEPSMAADDGDGDGDESDGADDGASEDGGAVNGGAAGTAEDGTPKRRSRRRGGRRRGGRGRKGAASAPTPAAE